MQLDPHRHLTEALPLGLRLLLPLGCLSALATGMVALTQLLAHHLRYAPSLGTPALAQLPPLPAVLLALGHLYFLLFFFRRVSPFLAVPLFLPGFALLAAWSQGPLYDPFEGFRWTRMLIFSSAGRDVLGQAAGPVTGGVAFLVIATLATRALVARHLHPSKIAHGSARYATFRDLKDAELLRPGGIFLGAFPHRGKRRWITDDSEHHTLFVMPSGAGKSAGHIIPSLLTRTHHAFVLDPKGELYAATAGWRAAQGHRCIRLAPLESPLYGSDRWNPLAEVPRDGDDTGTLSLLAEALLASAAAQREPHWDESARALFRCLALHALYTARPPTFAQIRSLAHHSQGIDAALEAILKASHDPFLRQGWLDAETGQPTPTHPEAALLARGFLDTPEKEMGSIASTLRRALALWGDPRIQANTAVSDFHLQLFNAPEPVTLYCVIPYSDLHRLAPWVRILLASLMRQITHSREVTARPPLLDLYLDEFASLGQVTIIHQILSFLRGYRVRAHIVVQSYDDLRRIYGPGENITACQIHVVAATQSRESRQFISDLAGEATVHWERASHSGRRMRPIKSHESRTTMETRRPLVTAAEVGTLSSEEILIAKTGLPLIRARKSFYFRDGVLAERALTPTPLPRGEGLSEAPALPQGAPVFPEAGGSCLSEGGAVGGERVRPPAGGNAGVPTTDPPSEDGGDADAPPTDPNGGRERKGWER